ncbi:hypothetical protein MGSAQ_000028 [marine sediment metagenome]|uniref:Uncharacterized protein n=1 Tax=marine sediment metagenome TaxID=412755 RepID=A0A1B6NYK1_9ZZZZ
MRSPIDFEKKEEKYKRDENSFMFLLKQNSCHVILFIFINNLYFFTLNFLDHMV